MDFWRFGTTSSPKTWLMQSRVKWLGKERFSGGLGQPPLLKQGRCGVLAK